MVDVALQYIAWGFHVLALHTAIRGRCDCYRPGCDSAGKHPRTKHGVLDATADTATARQWFTRWPFANLGIATSGLIVINVDPPGLSEWQELSRRLELRTTRTVRTGSGGIHVMYSAPAGVTVGNCSGRLPPGIDVRGKRL